MAPNGSRYRRLGEWAGETEKGNSLESRFFDAAHQPSGARLVGRFSIAPSSRSENSCCCLKRDILYNYLSNHQTLCLARKPINESTSLLP